MQTKQESCPQNERSPKRGFRKSDCGHCGLECSRRVLHAGTRPGINELLDRSGEDALTHDPSSDRRIVTEEGVRVEEVIFFDRGPERARYPLRLKCGTAGDLKYVLKRVGNTARVQKIEAQRRITGAIRSLHEGNRATPTELCSRGPGILAGGPDEARVTAATGAPNREGGTLPSKLSRRRVDSFPIPSGQKESARTSKRPPRFGSATAPEFCGKHVAGPADGAGAPSGRKHRRKDGRKDEVRKHAFLAYSSSGGSESVAKRYGLGSSSNSNASYRDRHSAYRPKEAYLGKRLQREGEKRDGEQADPT